MTVDESPNPPTPPLTARDVCQLWREVTFERRTVTRACGEGYDGRFVVDIDGWKITLGNALDHCEACVSPDGRRWSLGSGDRYGTDPVALLSTWEHATLVRLLRDL